MANLTDLTDFLARELDETIVTNAYGSSRYLSLATPMTGSLGGKRFTSIGNPIAGIVSARGGNKPVSQPTTSHLDADPVEWAVQVPFHKDLLQSGLENVSATLATLAQGAIAKSVDYAIYNGEDENGVAVPANFGSFEDARVVSVESRADWIAAIKATLKGGRSADGAVVTAGQWLELSSLVTEFNVPLLNMVGDHINGGTINGIPVKVVDGVADGGVIGALRSGAKGGIPLGLDYEVQTQGTIGEGANAINLNNTNHYSLRVSGLVFYNFFDIDNFVRLGAVGS